MKTNRFDIARVRSIANRELKLAKKQDVSASTFADNLAFELRNAGFDTAWVPLSRDFYWVEIQGYIIDVCDAKGNLMVSIKHYSELNNSKLHKAAPAGMEHVTGYLPGQNPKNPKETYAKPYHLYDKVLWKKLGYEG